jgi:putative tryptophan/tyrosine transport system substrate-binding protein
MVREAAGAARALGVQLRVLEARSPNDLDTAFRAITGERADALPVLADAFFRTHGTRIADFAAKSHLPSVSGEREQAEAGGLISYGPSRLDMFRRAAIYVDKILKGAKPADLAVEQPTTFELVVNLKTARTIGLTILPSLRLRADHVIE